MVYRANVTNIPCSTTDIYYLHNRNFVSDERSIYIEVDSEEEAEIIESLNDAYSKVKELRQSLFEFRRDHESKV